MDFTAFDQIYENGQFRFFQGGTGSPKNVQAPKDAVTSVIGAAGDSEVYSYMGTDGPRALVCNVTTSGGKSTGKYFVCKADLSGTDVSWSLIAGGTTGITLVVNSGSPSVSTPVAGNPSGVVQVGTNLYINDYDTTNVYTVAIAALEASTTGADVSVTSYPIPGGMLPTDDDDPDDVKVHGVSLIALTGNNGTSPVTRLFALYNGAFEDGSHMPNPYVNGTVVRLAISGATVVAEQSVTVGKNTQSLTPVYDDTGAVNLLVPAIGGYQYGGNTNGSDSTLQRVSSTFGLIMAVSTVFIGDGAPGGVTPVTTTGNYDIKSVGASDSAIVWLLLVTNDSNYRSWWRLFKTTVTKILAIGATGKSLTDAITDRDLIPVDSGFGSPGYYWELLCESSITDPGRLWFVMGTPIRISAMDNYDDKVLFDEGSLYAKVTGSPFPASVNVNSADLIGEMIYQYNLGNSIDTRLIKGQKPAQDEDDK
jgi:hypothetical protein